MLKMAKSKVVEDTAPSPSTSVFPKKSKKLAPFLNFVNAGLSGRNYKGVANAFVRIVREEGMSTLWQGSVATMGRAAIVNMSQLATYSQAKYTIAQAYSLEDGYLLHFNASMLSGLITSFNSMPFDIAKTRLQNLRASEKIPGVFTLILGIARNEGITALWKGFWPTYARIGPHTVITLMFNERFAKICREHFAN